MFAFVEDPNRCVWTYVSPVEPAANTAHTPARNAPAAFGGGALIGTDGLGGAECRLPLLIGLFNFAALEAIILNRAMRLVVVAAARPFRAIAAAVIIGIVASLLGVAGGELLIAPLVFRFGADVKLAGSLSLAVTLPTMILGFTRYNRNQSFAVACSWVSCRTASCCRRSP